MRAEHQQMDPTRAGDEPICSRETRVHGSSPQISSRHILRGGYISTCPPVPPTPFSDSGFGSSPSEQARSAQRRRGRMRAQKNDIFRLTGHEIVAFVEGTEPERNFTIVFT